ncbi:MAG: T9SS type A sorting domain-containing protein [Bacteroidota bacterium]
MKILYILIILISSVTSAAFAQTPAAAWGNFFGGKGNDDMEASCTDPSGNYYVVGYFAGTGVDFDPGSGTTIRSTTNDADLDGYLVKFNSAGVFQWVTTFGGSGSDGAYGVAADANGVYVTGYFQNTADFDPVGTTTKVAVGSYDIFVAKYNVTNGNLLFVNAFGDTGTDYGRSITVSGSSIYVTGTFIGDIDFDPSANSHVEISWGGSDIFLASYSTTGTYQWSIDIGSTGDDYGTSVVTEGTLVWISGEYSDTFYVDPQDYSQTISNLGGSDGFAISYYASDGTLYGGGTIRSSGDDSATSLALDGGGGLYVGGVFSGTASMYGSVNNKSVTSKGLLDNFVARYNAYNYDLVWLNGFGSTGSDFLSSITADPGSVYATGQFLGTMDVDPSAATVNMNLTGTADTYFVKYNYLGGAYVTNFTLASASSNSAGRSIIDDRGYIYIAGAFAGNVDLDPSSGSNVKASNTSSVDCFITRFNPVEPSASATSGSIVFSNLGATSFTVTFSSPQYNDGYITLYDNSGVPTAVPVDNTVYAREASPGGGTGKALNSSPATSYTITGLTPSTNYYLSIFPYNGYTGANGNINYKTSSPVVAGVTTLSLSTEPTGQPSNVQVTNITTSSLTISYTAAPGPPTGYIALRASGTGISPNTDPVDGITYTVGQSLGNATVAYVGSATTFNQSSLAFGTTYTYKLYAYNGSGGAINYRTSSPPTTITGTFGAAEPTAQPKNLVFSNETSSGYDYKFDASTGSNIGGYIGFRKSGSAPTFVPTDGVALTEGSTNADGSFVAFMKTNTSYNSTSATPSTTYYYTIYAYNGTGTNINYLTTSPLTGNVTTLEADDTTSPTITDHTPTSIGPTEGVTISVDITDDESGVDYAFVEYYPINTADYGDHDLVNSSGDTYTFAIPSSFNKGQGIEYKITAVDVAGNQTETYFKSVILNYTGTGLQIPYAFGSDKTSYRIISVPLNLTSPKVTDVFDEFGTTYDKTKYRLFHYANNSVAELSGTSNIELGKGYWFIASENKGTVNSGAGTTALTGLDRDVVIPVSNGWNQLGNPYNFEVSWNLVVTHNTDKTFTKFKSYEGKFNDASTLKKMGGAFVMVSVAGDGNLVIPVDKDARVAAPELPNFAQTIDSDTWGVDLLVKSGDMENTFAGFGMHPDASEQSDRFDDFTLPRFVDYLELNYNKKLFGSFYTKDIVPTSTQHVWEFQLASNVDSDVIELSWDNSYFGSSTLQLLLWDVNQQRAVDMRTQNRYTIERSQAGTFKIFYGTESFVKQETLPNMAVFHSVSPVPSSGNVTLAFSVPDSNGDVKTNLSIYNSLGQKVSKLVDDTLPAGYHQAVWNIDEGTKPAAGVYISVLKFGETTLQKRLVIK